MMGNLSRTVLRGVGDRESARLPDLTNFAYGIQPKKQQKRIYTFIDPLAIIKKYFLYLLLGSRNY
jgi:hypothetical protein